MIQPLRKSGYLARKYTNQDIDRFLDLDDKESSRLRQKGVLREKIDGIRIVSPGEFLCGALIRKGTALCR